MITRLISKRRSRKAQNTLTASAFLLPNLLGFLGFTAIPLVFSLVMAFTNWEMTATRGPEFVGLANFADLVRDKRFWKFLGNTAYLMMGIPVSIAGSVLLAVVLSQKLRGLVFWRTLYYLPTITSGVALFLLWKTIYNPEFGPLNTLLRTAMFYLGIEGKPPDWLLDVNWAKPAIMLMGIWTAIGGTNMLLYLAALSNVPPELTEAAAIDGAGPWARFRHVTWPQLAPTTFFIVVMSCIGGLQGGFEQARVMTNGGPAESTITLGYHIYIKGFEEFQLGYASAIAWVLFVVIFAMTLVNWRFGQAHTEWQ